MKCTNEKGAGQASLPPAQPDSEIALNPSNLILAEKRRRRRAVEIHLVRGESGEFGVTVIDLRIGRWWFSLIWKVAFDIGRESGGDIIPVFPDKAGE